MDTRAETPRGSRIEITEDRLKVFFEDIFKGDSVSKFSHSKGLPYSLVYNVVHGRIGSLSARDYRIIFGQDPPQEDVTRVDGAYFRGMVRLWLFLHRDVTEADLYKEFYPEKGNGKVDYRIFTGKTKTVDARLETLMEAKFRAQGLDRCSNPRLDRRTGRYGWRRKSGLQKNQTPPGLFGEKFGHQPIPNAQTASEPI